MGKVRVVGSSQPTNRPVPSGEASYREELALHARIRAGDESALMECLDRFGPVVYCALLRATEDVALTEDLTERGFVSLWRSPTSFDPRRGPMALQLLAALASSVGAARRTPDPAVGNDTRTRAAA